MKRSDKGKAVTRYLGAASGIPLLFWDGNDSTIQAPYPYSARVSTDAATWRFFEYLREMPNNGVPFVIRYDKYLDSVADAIVGTRLSVFSGLLAAHYDTIRDRIDTKRKGD